MDKHDDESRLIARRQLLKTVAIGVGLAVPLMASFSKDGLQFGPANASAAAKKKGGGYGKGGKKK